MALVFEVTCPICHESAKMPLQTSTESTRTGLYMAHLIGEHWEAVQQMRVDLGTVTPGAWKRIAESWK